MKSITGVCETNKCFNIIGIIDATTNIMWIISSLTINNDGNNTGVCETTLLLYEPWPYNPASETALQPLIWCSSHNFPRVLFSEGVFFHRHRYERQESLQR